MVRGARKSALLTMRAPFYRVKKFGAEAARPTLPGGRGGCCGAGRGCCGGAPKKLPNAGGAAAGWIGRSFFGFGGGGVAITGVVPPSGEADATGTSPLACS